MRALPNFTVVEPADAIETRQVVAAIAERPGPVYLRLKRGEIPVIFDDGHRLDLSKAQTLTGGGDADVCIVASGMMIPAALAAACTLGENGVTSTVINVPVIKPLDGATIAAAARRSRLVISAENHTVIGGLGSAVAETLAEAGIAAPLRRVGIADTFAEAGSREYLFAKYGLGTQDIVDAAWQGLAVNRPVPVAPVIEASPGAYAPV
jgi:transketolase